MATCINVINFSCIMLNIQKGNQFRRGMNDHGQAADQGATQRVKVAAKVKINIK